MSASPPSPTGIPPNVHVEEIAAPQLFGGLGNWFQFGVLVVQIYVYSYNFPEDRTHIKLMVYGVFLLEILQTALDGANLYHWFASGFGNFEALTSPYAVPFDVAMIESLVSLTVQFFFIYRIMVLSKKRSWWYCVFILLCSIVSSIAAFSVGVYSRIHEKFPTGGILKVTMLTYVIGTTISDLLITSAMVFYLVKRRTREEYASSHVVVSIVKLLVETNIATTTVSFTTLLMVLLYPNKNWFFCSASMIGKVYSNTLLVSLNNRIAIRERTVFLSGETGLRSPAGFPHNTCRSGVTIRISLSLTDTREAPDTLMIHALGGLDVDEGIITEISRHNLG